MLAMHSQEVFLHVIGTIERFVTDVAMKRFLLAMDVLVSGVQVATIGSIGTVGASVSFHTGCYRYRGHCRGILRK